MSVRVCYVKNPLTTRAFERFEVGFGHEFFTRTHSSHSHIHAHARASFTHSSTHSPHIRHSGDQHHLPQSSPIHGRVWQNLYHERPSDETGRGGDAHSCQHAASSEMALNGVFAMSSMSKSRQNTCQSSVSYQKSATTVEWKSLPVGIVASLNRGECRKTLDVSVGLMIPTAIRVAPTET